MRGVVNAHFLPYILEDFYAQEPPPKGLVKTLHAKTLETIITSSESANTEFTCLRQFQLALHEPININRNDSQNSNLHG